MDSGTSSSDYVSDYDNKVTLTNLAVGFYAVKVIDDGVTGTDDSYTLGGKVTDKNYLIEYFTLSNSQTITWGTSTVKDQTCYGTDYDGAISPVIIVEGDDNLTYSWSGPSGYTSSDKDISGLRPGTYVLTVTDSDGCYSRETFKVSAATEIEFNLSVEGDACDVNERYVEVYYLDENGNKVAGVTGGNTNNGTTAYIFDWTGESDVTFDETTYIATGLIEGGVYTLTVRDANMCSVSKSTDELHSAVSVEATIGDVSCYDGNNGQITPTISGGIGNYKYRWYTADPTSTIGEDTEQASVTTNYELKNSGDNVVTTRIASNLSAGNYWFVVTDWETSSYTGCCHNYIYQYEVTEPNQLQVSATPVTTSCYGSADGKITVDVVGGVAPYTYTWNLGTSMVETESDQLEDLTSGTYFVIVTDANGCSETAEATVEDAPNIDFTITATTDVDCDGENGVLEVTFDDSNVVPGEDNVRLLWNGPSIESTSASENKLVQDGLASGLYSVTVMRNGGCTTTKQYQFVTPMSIGDPVITNNRCSGAKTGEIQIEVSGGSGSYSYEWSAYEDLSKTTEISYSGINNNNGAYQAGLMSGYYYVTVTDNGRYAQDGVTNCTIEGGPYYVENAMALDVVITEGSETCYGSLDGQISVYVDGGSGNYSFEWYGTGDGIVQGQQNQVALGAGEYTVTVTDVNNSCSVSKETTVAGSDKALEIVVKNVDDVECYGASTGSIEVTATGGTMFENSSTQYYKWTYLGQEIDEETLTLSDLKAGNYNFVVEDSYGCTVSESVEVTQNDEITATESVTHITNTGVEDGEVVITAISGGKAPYTVKWYEGSTVDSSAEISTTNQYRITGLSAGTYTYVITDAQGCTSTTTVSVNDDSALYVDIQKVTDVLCSGESTGRIEVLVTNGTAPYTITVNGVISVDNYSGGIYAIRDLAAGIYNVSVVDAAGSTQSKAITIEQPDEAFEFTVEQVDKQCYGSSVLGSVQLTITGGTPFVDASSGNYYNVVRNISDDFTIVENNGVYTETVTGLSLNTHLFTATDANGCQVAQYVTLEEYDEITIDDPTIVDVLCNGASTGEIEVTVNGVSNPQYEWTYNGSYTVAAETLGNTNKLTGIPAGTYTLVVTESGTSCSATFEYEVTEPTEIVATATKYDITTCAGDDSGQILVSVTGGVSPYTVECYNVLSTTDVDSRTISTSSTTFSSLVGGTYMVTIYDANGCGYVFDPITISEPTELSIVDLDYGIDCADSDGYIQFNISGGSASSTTGYTNYEVRITGAMNGVQVVRGSLTDGGYKTTDLIEYTGLTEGSYLITIKDENSTDLNQCMTTQLITLSNMHINVESITDPTCEGKNDGSIMISVSGNTGDVTYLWERNTGDGWEEFTIGKDNQNATTLPEGSYRVTVTDLGRDDGNGSYCSISREFELEYQNEFSISESIRHEQCYGASDGAITNVTVLGVDDQSTVEFYWSGSNFVSTASEVSNLDPGSYLLTITDTQTGCSLTKEYTIEAADAALNIELSDENNDCDYERVITMKVSGGAGGNTYYVNGASTNLSLVDAGTDGDAIVKTLTVDKGGTYKFIVRDKNNCEASEEIELAEELALTADVTNNSCYNASEGSIYLVVSGGSREYTYEWTGPDGFTSDQADLSSLKAGDYTVTVTDKNENVGGTYCSISKTYTITQPEEIVITGSVSDITCAGDNNGVISVTVSGGKEPYSYIWSNGETTRQISGLGGGTYTVNVVDANACTNTKTFTLYEPKAISYTLTVTQDVDCSGEGGALSIDPVTGGWDPDGTGASYVIEWSGEACTGSESGSLAISDLTSYANGHYQVTVRDAADGHSSCYLTQSYDFKTPLTASYVAVDETCEGQVDGSIRLTVSGGTLPYTYEWTTTDGEGLADGASSQDGLRSGTYSVKITDADNCSVEINDIYIGRLNSLNIISMLTDVKCAGDNNGSIKLDITGGSGDYSYNWTGTCTTLVQGAKDQTALTRGQYSVTITDNVLGCEVTNYYEVGGADTELEISDIDVTDVLCKGEYTGAITVSVAGGIAPYSYSWSGDDVGFGNTATIENLKAGSYQVVVSDYKGCIVSSGSISVSEPSKKLTVATTSIIDNIVKGGTAGEITISVSGGMGSYSYAWYSITTDDDGNTTTTEITGVSNKSHISGLSAGLYEVTVTDENNCTATLTNIHVGEPNEELTFSIVTTDVTPCYGDANGMIDIDVYGGTLPYTIIFYNSDGIEETRSTDASSLNVTNLTPGTYKVSITDANGYQVDGEATITQPDALTLSKTRVNVECYDASTGSFTLTVTGGVQGSLTTANYQVSITGPDGYSNVNSAFTGTDTYTDLKAGVYSVMIFDDSNEDGRFTYDYDCWLSDTIEVHQPEAHADLSKVDLDEDMYICQGESTELKIVISNWSDLATKPLNVVVRQNDDERTDVVYNVSVSPYVFSVAPEESSTYKIVAIYEDDSSCGRGTFDEEYELVEVRRRPTAYIHGDFDVCLGSTVEPTIDLTTQGESLWTIVVTDGTNNYTYSNVDETPYQFSYTASEVGSIELSVISVSDNNCESIAEDMTGTTTIAVNSLPVVSMSGSTTICDGESATLTFHVTDGTAPYTLSYYYWDPNDETNKIVSTFVSQYLDDSGNLYATVSPHVSTKYYIQGLVDAKGCSPLTMTDEVEIAVKSLPTIPNEINGDDLVCQGAEGINYYVVPVDGEEVGYSWTVPDGMEIVAGDGSASITVKTTSEFEGGLVQVRTTNNCSESSLRQKLVSPSYLPVKPTGGVVSQNGSIFCQSQTGIILSVATISYATTYEWELPSGFSITYGEGTQNIVVAISETLNNLTGIIKVRGVNSCGEGEWSDDFEVAVYPLPSVSAGNDQNICGGTTVMSGSAVPTGGTGIWTKVNGGAIIADETDPTTSVSNITQGDNVFNWTVTTAMGCSVTDEVVIRNNELNVTARTIQTFICDGETQLQGTNIPDGCTGLWTVQDGYGIFEDAQVANTMLTDLQQGTSTLRWTITQNGCESYADVEVTNSEPDLPTITIRTTADGEGKLVTVDEDGYRYVVCGDEIYLEGNDVTSTVFPDQYAQWDRVTGGGTFSADITQASQHITGLTNGENIYRYTVINDGCRQELTVVIYNAQLNVSAGLDVATCDESVTLTGSALPNDNCVGHWEIIDSSKKATFSDGQSNKTTVSNMSKGEIAFRWVILNEGCESSDTVVVTNNRTTTATTQASITVCDGSTAFTGNQISSAYETAQWEIVSGYADIVDINDPNTRASNFDRGTNVFRWKITSLQGGCSSYSDQIVYNNAIDVNAGLDTAVCSTQTTLRAVSPTTGGSWSIVPGKGSATIADIESATTTVGGLSFGENMFIWTVESNGCSSADTVVITNNMPKFNVDGDQPNTSINGDATITLSASATGVNLNGYEVLIGEGTWTLQSGAGTIEDVHQYNTYVSGLASGTNTFIWTAVNEGCVVDGTVDVVWGEVKAAVAGDNVYDLCSDTYTLGANGPYNGIGQWSVVKGTGSFVDSTDPLTKVTGLQKGQNIFRWTITYNSGSTYSDVEIWNMSVTEANASTDRTICGYEYELQGNEQKVGSYTVEKADGTVEQVTCTQLWTIISGGGTFTDKNGISTQADTLYNAYVTNLKQGANTFEYKIYNEYCESSDQVVITNDMADQAIAYVGNDQDTIITCDGTVRLYPNTPSYGTGVWTLVAGGQASFDGNDAYNLAQGRNYLIWEISTETGGECTTADTVLVVNNTPTTADAGPDLLTVCGTQGTLTGNKPSNFTEAYWELREGGGMFVDPESGELVDRVTLYPSSTNEAQTLTVKGLNFGNNRFRWVIKNGTCESTDETVLDNIYIQAVAGSVAPSCSDTVQLSANNPSPGVGRWSVMPGYGQGSFIDPDDYNTKVTNLSSGENLLLWSVNYLECPSYDTLSVINNKATTAYIEGSTQTLCDTNATILTAGALAVDETGAWTETGRWEIADGGGTIASPNSNTTAVTDIPFNANGNTYRWIITRTYNETVCISTAQVVVEYNRVDAYAGEDQLLCSSEAIMQATSAGAATGTWTVTGAASAATFTNENDPTTAVTGLGLGENILRWTTSYKGCEDYDEVTIVNGSPSVPYAGSEQNTCDDVVTLNASLPETGTGVWSTVSGLASWDDSNKYTANATVEIGKGDNTFRWTVTNETPIFRGLDEDSKAVYDTLTCRLYDDVTIHNQNPSEPYAGDSRAICSDSYELKAVTPDYGDGLWTIVSSGGGIIADPTSPQTKVTSLAYGTTRFRWTLSVDGSCAKYDEVEITNFSPTTSDAGPDIEDCSSCAVLDANTPVIGDGRWDVISGSLNDEYGDPSFDNVNDPKTSVCNLIFGENKFLWIIENIVSYDGSTFRCESVDTVSVWNMMPDQADANDDQIRCKDYTVMNAAVPTVGEGTWTLVQGEGTIVDENDPKTKITDLGYGENIFRWTVTYGSCSNEDDVVVYSNTASPYAGENDVTYTDYYQLNAGNPGRLTGYWTSLSSSTSVSFADSTDYRTMVYGLARGVNTFRWTIETDDCLVYDEVSITYKVVPEAGFSVDNEAGCSPLTVRFTDESISATSYNWDFGDGTESTVRSPSHTYQLPGNYKVTLTVPGPDDQESTYYMYITVYSHPEASFTASPQLVYLPDDKVHFMNLSTDADTYLWSFGDGGTSELKNPTYVYSAEGLYTVTLQVWNEYGCDADTTKEDFIEARRGGFIVFPNTFAPREDVTGNTSIFGVNATFRPVYQDVTSFHMEIYNRWGQKIFETDDINEGWDGRFNGDLAPEGIYVYTARGKYVSGKEYTKSGQVLIIK